MNINIKDYREVLIVEKLGPVGNRSSSTLIYPGTQKRVPGRLTELADLILIHDKGDFFIYKNRYGMKGGLAELPDDQLARLYLTS